jgi:hypothetical protein
MLKRRLLLLLLLLTLMLADLKSDNVNGPRDS